MSDMGMTRHFTCTTTNCAFNRTFYKSFIPLLGLNIYEIILNVKALIIIPMGHSNVLNQIDEK